MNKVDKPYLIVAAIAIAAMILIGLTGLYIGADAQSSAAAAEELAAPQAAEQQEPQVQFETVYSGWNRMYRVRDGDITCYIWTGGGMDCLK